MFVHVFAVYILYFIFSPTHSESCKLLWSGLNHEAALALAFVLRAIELMFAFARSVRASVIFPRFEVICNPWACYRCVLSPVFQVGAMSLVQNTTPPTRCRRAHFQCSMDIAPIGTNVHTLRVQVHDCIVLTRSIFYILNNTTARLPIIFSIFILPCFHSFIQSCAQRHYYCSTCIKMCLSVEPAIYLCQPLFSNTSTCIHMHSNLLQCKKKQKNYARVTAVHLYLCCTWSLCFMYVLYTSIYSYDRIQLKKLLSLLL